MTIRCPAKINLDLRVGPLRADGFHSIRSWFVSVGLYDDLAITAANDVWLSCSDPSLPTDERNLVMRAADALHPLGGPGVKMHLTKRIPAGGGLGGGSSDAGAALLALNAFWKMNLPLDRLHAVAARLGSDVPFFLHGPSSLCEGRGEVVTPVPPPACRWAVLVLPGIEMPTPAVFRKLDEIRPDAAEPSTQAAPPATARAVSLLKTLVNDLEPAAFALRPDLATLRDAAEGSFGRTVRMSGSGSTLFTLYDNGPDATAAAATASAGLGVKCIAVEVAPA